MKPVSPQATQLGGPFHIISRHAPPRGNDLKIFNYEEAERIDEEDVARFEPGTFQFSDWQFSASTTVLQPQFRHLEYFGVCLLGKYGSVLLIPQKIN